MKKFLKYMFNYKSNLHKLKYPVILPKDLSTGVMCGSKSFRIEIYKAQSHIDNPKNIEIGLRKLLDKSIKEISDKIKSSITIDIMGKERPLLEIRYPICIEGWEKKEEKSSVAEEIKKAGGQRKYREKKGIEETIKGYKE